MRRLGVIVSTPPERGDFARAERLARAARARGIEVSLFLMDAAVDAGAGAGGAALVEDGCELVLCGTSATARGITAAPPGALLGSQDDHAAIVHRADRVVAFT